LKIGDFFATLPSSIISGDDIIIPDDFFRKMFSFCDLNPNDVFYHLGVGKNYSSLLIARQEFGVRKSVGIEIDPNVIDLTRSKIDQTIDQVYIINEDVVKSSLSEATVIFSWFTDEKINEKLLDKYKNDVEDGTRIISIWSPPDLLIPDKVDFPIILCKKPFNFGLDIKDQLKKLYGTNCIDFTASWLLSEKYIQAFGIVESQHVRFLNILQSVMIWFNARDLDLVCEDEVPPPIKSYVGILKYFFDIDLSDFLVK
jgi:hypothetical protein